MSCDYPVIAQDPRGVAYAEAKALGSVDRPGDLACALIGTRGILPHGPTRIRGVDHPKPPGSPPPCLLSDRPDRPACPGPTHAHSPGAKLSAHPGVQRRSSPGPGQEAKPDQSEEALDGFPSACPAPRIDQDRLGRGLGRTPDPRSTPAPSLNDVESDQRHLWRRRRPLSRPPGRRDGPRKRTPACILSTTAER